MKHIKKNIALLLSFSASLLADSCTSVAPYFSVRSQSVNQPRLMVGMVDQVHRIDIEKFYGTFSIIPGYSQSFRDSSIAKCLFGRSLQTCGDCPAIKISGSQVSDRGSCDWLADYFGLSPKFQSTVRFEPKIKTATVDFAFHVGLDEWVSGLWLRVWAPFVHTRWDLNVCESSVTKGDIGYDAGYFTGTTDDPFGAVPVDNLLNNALAFFRQGKTPNLGTGFTFEPLRSCKWGDCGCDGALTQDGLADLRFGLGWNFFQDDDYHIGLGIMAAAPTGNRPDGTVLFEPMVGNGNHWEVGAMWTSHVIFWRSEDEDNHLGGYLDANITHLFKTSQKRCFDLCGKPMSRYMLAEKMKTSVVDLAGADMQAADTSVTGQTGVKPTHQFDNKYAPVGNLTCSEVDVSIGVQADVVAMLNYTHGGFSFDVGYNLWARSCEKIELNCDCPPRISKELWALKGDARTYGFQPATANPPAAAIPLSATESKATIFKGTNQGMTDGLKFNLGVDAPKFAQVAEITTGQSIQYKTPSTDIMDQVKTSVQPILIKQGDINLNGARTKGLSHSLFMHFSYAWVDNEDWTPSLGIGFQGEFANNSGDCNKCCPTNAPCSITCPPSTNPSCSTPCSTNPSSSCGCCDSCKRCALSQWSVFVKGGIFFN